MFLRTLVPLKEQPLNTVIHIVCHLLRSITILTHLPDGNAYTKIHSTLGEQFLFFVLLLAKGILAIVSNLRNDGNAYIYIYMEYL